MAKVPAPVYESVLAESERRVVLPARSAGYELQTLGVTGWPLDMREPVLLSDGRRMVFSDFRSDPTIVRRRWGKGKPGIPFPDDQEQRLLPLLGVIDVDHVVIGHELPPGWQPGDPLVPPPRQIREADEHRLRLLQEASRRIGVGVRAFAQATGLVLGGAAALALGGLDPMILGGVEHPELPAASWTILAQWEWE